jgi:hypothetical protein
MAVINFDRKLSLEIVGDTATVDYTDAPEVEGIPCATVYKFERGESISVSAGAEDGIYHALFMNGNRVFSRFEAPGRKSSKSEIKRANLRVGFGDVVIFSGPGLPDGKLPPLVTVNFVSRQDPVYLKEYNTIES